MKDLVIIGAGSFGREAAQIVEDINLDKKKWNLLGFIDETAQKRDTLINSIPVLGNFDWLKKNLTDCIYSVCAIGNPKDKYNLIKKASAFGVNFCNLIHPDAKISKFVQL